jgi:hypothetical protein
MDKISGILPSNARVTSVDMKDSGPIRGGVPSFGRTETVSPAKSNLPPQDTAQRGAAAHQQLNDWRSKDQKAAAVAGEVTDRFFSKKNEVDVEPRTEIEMEEIPLQTKAMSAPVASQLAGFKGEVGGLHGGGIRQPGFGHAMEADEEPTMLRQPEGLYPKGSFLDRSA